MAWVKIDKCSDWGTVFYTEPGKSLTKYGTHTREHELDLKAGMMVRVRFPDGFELEKELSSVICTRTISDMGRLQSYKAEHLGVECLFHGVTIWIAIEKLELEL